MKKVLLIVAQAGFQTKEYFDTRRELEAQGVPVCVAAPLREPAVSNTGEEIMPDIALAEVGVGDYSGIFITGGPGALADLDNATTARILKQAQEAKIFYGAICISPRILAKAGVLTGKRATGWDGDGKLDAIFEKYGVDRASESVVVDDKVITADGPAVANEFGQKIAELVL